MEENGEKNLQKCTQIENIIGLIFALILRIRKNNNGNQQLSGSDYH